MLMLRFFLNINIFLNVDQCLITDQCIVHCSGYLAERALDLTIENPETRKRLSRALNVCIEAIKLGADLDNPSSKCTAIVLKKCAKNGTNHLLRFTGSLAKGKVMQVVQENLAKKDFGKGFWGELCKVVC
jgi:hypothetical protein